MRKTERITLIISAMMILGMSSELKSQQSAPELLKLTQNLDVSVIKTEKSNVSIENSDNKTKLKIIFLPSSGFPNIKFPCPESGLDLSTYKGVQVEVSNIGKASIRVCLRVDNEGNPQSTPPPWNTNGLELAPGETRNIQVIFGQSYGQPSFNLNSKAITGIQIFTSNPPPESSITVCNLSAF